MPAPRPSTTQDRRQGRWLPGLSSPALGPSVLVTTVAGDEVYVGGTRNPGATDDTVVLDALVVT